MIKFKRFLPKTLFYRFILIITIPTIIIQIVSIYVFYQRHWDVVSKRLSQNLVKDISLANTAFDVEIAKSGDYLVALNKVRKNYGLEVVFLEGGQLEKKYLLYEQYKPPFLFDSRKQFENELVTNVEEKMNFLEFDDKNFILKIQKPTGVLNFTINKKRIITVTTKVFIWWNVGIASAMSFVAIMFLRNQIKPIKRLTEVAKSMTIDKDPQFKPTGAKEIREVGVAFIKMRQRIKNFINQRTIMLAAISHDLRTPLTRLKLQLEMVDDEKAKLMKGDIEEMESMINEYLSFAKGEQGEGYSKLKLKSYMKSIIQDYKRVNADVKLDYKVRGEKAVNIKKYSFKRALNNIIGNALKYGDKVLVMVENNKTRAIISVEDNGAGVPEKELDKIAEPFYKSDASRNMDKGGVGLGLAIAKDIIQSHNGNISFGKSTELGGLKVVVRIPIVK